MNIPETLTFDDVLLRPKFSRIRSRSEVDLSVEVSKGFKFAIPFIPANMASVISLPLLREIYRAKGMVCLHRFLSLKEQVQMLTALFDQFGEDAFNYIGVSVGVKPEDYTNIPRLLESGAKIICVDVAHAHSVQALEMTRFISQKYPQVLLIVGNVATAEGTTDLYRAGADIVKVGIGSSGICSTRLETGNGVSQLSAVMECHERRQQLIKELQRPLFLISDGGHSIPADCVKSLCFADLVMLGGMFARTLEAAGEVVRVKGQQFKQYHGSSTHKQDRVEGVKALVKMEGTVAELLKRLSEGLQSGCSYQNARNLVELKIDPHFTRITSAGLKETQIHNIAWVE